MNKKGVLMIGTLVFLATAGWVSPAFAETATTAQRDWAPLIAKIAMGLSLTLALSGSALGLSISFQALLAGGTDNFYKNIAVALMPSTQGIYGMVVLITNVDKFDSDPYTVACKAMIAGLTLFISAWYQGVVCAAGIKSILEGKNTLANSLVSGAMPETYAVFSLVMTFIVK